MPPRSFLTTGDVAQLWSHNEVSEGDAGRSPNALSIGPSVRRNIEPFFPPTSRIAGRKTSIINDETPLHALRMVRLPNRNPRKEVVDVLRDVVNQWSSLASEHLMAPLGILHHCTGQDVFVYMCYPRINGVPLMEYISRFPSPDRLKLLSDIAFAIRYMHSTYQAKQSVPHGDVVCENVFVDEEGCAQLGPPLLASIYQKTAAKSSNYTVADIRGMSILSSRHRPPESLFENEAAALPGDTYAFGCLAYQLFAGHWIFHDKIDPQFIALLLKGKRPERPPLCCEGLWSIIQACWAHDKTIRPRMADVYNALQKLRGSPVSSSIPITISISE